AAALLRAVFRHRLRFHVTGMRQGHHHVLRRNQVFSLQIGRIEFDLRAAHVLAAGAVFVDGGTQLVGHDRRHALRPRQNVPAVGRVGAALMIAIKSSILASATARPSSTWPRSRALRSSNTVRRVTTSRRCDRKHSSICFRFSSFGWPLTSATMFMPKVSCSWVCLYRLLS